MKADQDHPTGGKNIPVVLQVDEIEVEDIGAGEQTETESLVPYLQQINVRIEQQTEVLCVMIGIGCGFSESVVFDFQNGRKFAFLKFLQFFRTIHVTEHLLTYDSFVSGSRLCCICHIKPQAFNMRSVLRGEIHHFSSNIVNFHFLSPFNLRLVK